LLSCYICDTITIGDENDKRGIAIRAEISDKDAQKGYKRAEILEISGLSESTLKHLFADFNKNGDSVVKLKKRGRKVGEKRTLSAAQEKQVQKAIVDKDPNQFKLDCCVWDRVDNLKVHHSEKVKKWPGNHKKQIEVHYLPSYSPELNPDEYLNGNLKRNMAKNRKVSDVSSLKQNAKNIMLRFRKDKEHIKSWFKNKHIRYAA
jgi:transposase